MTLTATLSRNAAKKGLEIRFSEKPQQETLEALCESGFRWLRSGALWYARESERTLQAAMSIIAKTTDLLTISGEAVNTPPKISENRPSLWDRTRFTPNAEGPDDCRAHTVGSNYKANLSAKEIAAIVRKELRNRFPECKWSVTCGRATWSSTINVYLISSPYPYDRATASTTDRDASVSYHAVSAVVTYAKCLLASYNYNDSDTMTDYFDVHFCDYVEISTDYTQNEPTEAQKLDMLDFDACTAAEKEREQAERAARYREMEAQRKQQAEENAKRDAIAKKEVAAIEDAAIIRDLEPAQQYFLHGCREARKPCRVTARITREVVLTPQNFSKFQNLLMHGFTFFAKQGGRGTDDSRINSLEDYQRMTRDEQATVQWYSLGVAIVDPSGDLLCAVNPEGYDYARYMLLTDEATREEINA